MMLTNAYIVDEGGSPPPSGYDQIAYIDDFIGNDGSGTVNEAGQPFLTLAAAEAALAFVGGSKAIELLSNKSGISELQLSEPMTLVLGGYTLAELHITNDAPFTLYVRSGVISTLDWSNTSEIDPASHPWEISVPDGDTVDITNIAIHGATGANGNHGSSSANDSYGSNGSDGIDSESPGPGNVGDSAGVSVGNGESGSDGYSGRYVFLNGNTSAVFTVSNALNGYGGTGGNGGDGGDCFHNATGGNGGNGGNATGPSDSNGGDGGDGGSASAFGGNAGNGGTGGDGAVVTRTATVSIYSHNVDGGSGGNPGIAGTNSGSAYPGSGGSGGSPYGTGNTGASGNNGASYSGSGAMGAGGGNGAAGSLTLI